MVEGTDYVLIVFCIGLMVVETIIIATAGGGAVLPSGLGMFAGDELRGF
jgi:hypothetical protein